MNPNDDILKLQAEQAAKNKVTQEQIDSNLNIINQSSKQRGVQPTGYEASFNVQGGTPFNPLGKYDTLNPTNNPADQNYFRAIAQDNWDAFGTRLKQTIPNMVGGLIEGVGYLGALAFEWRDDRDYRNTLTDVGQKIAAWGKEGNEVYHKDPSDHLGFLSDGGAAIDVLMGGAESIALFFAEGAAIAKGIGMIGQGAKAGAMALQGSQKAAKANQIVQMASKLSHADRVRKAGQVLEQARQTTDRVASLARGAARWDKAINIGTKAVTIPTVSFLEGAMSGNKVYKDLTTKLKGQINPKTKVEYTEDEIKSIASSSAATTTQLNTAINSILNITSLAPMFKASAARGAFNRNINKALAEVEENVFKRTGKSLTEAQKNIAFSKLNGLTAAKTGLSEVDDLAKATFKADKSTIAETLVGGMKNPLSSKGFAGSLAGESLQEGIEELTNVFSEKTGMALGLKGEEKGLIEQFAEIEHYAERVSNDEGLASFILGAAMGGGMKVGGMAMIQSGTESTSSLVKPITQYESRLAAKDETLLEEAKKNGFNSAAEYVEKLKQDPKFQEERLIQSPKDKKTWKTAKGWEKEQERVEFEKTQHQVYQDLKNMQDIDNKIKVEMQKDVLDIEKIDMLKEEALSKGSMLNAFRNGTSEYFINYFNEITGLDNTTDLGDKVLEEIKQVEEEITKFESSNHAQGGSNSEAEQQTNAKIAELQTQKEALIKEYETLAGKTEAMVKGYAEHKDTINKQADYRLRAAELVTKFQKAENLYANIQSKYNAKGGDDAYYAEEIYLRHQQIEATELMLRNKEAKTVDFEDYLNQNREEAKSIMETQYDIRDNDMYEAYKKDFPTANNVDEAENILFERLVNKKQNDKNLKAIQEKAFADIKANKTEITSDSVNEAMQKAYEESTSLFSGFDNDLTYYQKTKELELLNNSLQTLITAEGKKEYMQGLNNSREEFRNKVNKAKETQVRETNAPLADELDKQASQFPTTENINNAQRVRNSSTVETGENQVPASVNDFDMGTRAINPAEAQEQQVPMQEAKQPNLERVVPPIQVNPFENNFDNSQQIEAKEEDTQLPSNPADSQIPNNIKEGVPATGDTSKSATQKALEKKNTSTKTDEQHKAELEDIRVREEAKAQKLREEKEAKDLNFANTKIKGIDLSKSSEKEMKNLATTLKVEGVEDMSESELRSSLQEIQNDKGFDFTNLNLDINKTRLVEIANTLKIPNAENLSKTELQKAILAIKEERSPKAIATKEKEEARKKQEAIDEQNRLDDIQLEKEIAEEEALKAKKQAELLEQEKANKAKKEAEAKIEAEKASKIETETREKQITELKEKHKKDLERESDVNYDLYNTLKEEDKTVASVGEIAYHVYRDYSANPYVKKLGKVVSHNDKTFTYVTAEGKKETKKYQSTIDTGNMYNFFSSDRVTSKEIELKDEYNKQLAALKKGQKTKPVKEVKSEPVKNKVETNNTANPFDGVPQIENTQNQNDEVERVENNTNPRDSQIPNNIKPKNNELSEDEEIIQFGRDVIWNKKLSTMASDSELAENQYIGNFLSEEEGINEDGNEYSPAFESQEEYDSYLQDYEIRLAAYTKYKEQSSKPKVKANSSEVTTELNQRVTKQGITSPETAAVRQQIKDKLVKESGGYTFKVIENTNPLFRAFMVNGILGLSKNEKGVLPLFVTNRTNASNNPNKAGIVVMDSSNKPLYVKQYKPETEMLEGLDINGNQAELHINFVEKLYIPNNVVEKAEQLKNSLKEKKFETDNAPDSYNKVTRNEDNYFIGTQDQIAKIDLARDLSNRTKTPFDNEQENGEPTWFKNNLEAKENFERMNRFTAQLSNPNEELKGFKIVRLHSKFAKELTPEMNALLNVAGNSKMKSNEGFRNSDKALNAVWLVGMVEGKLTGVAIANPFKDLPNTGVVSNNASLSYTFDVRLGAWDIRTPDIMIKRAENKKGKRLNKSEEEKAKQQAADSWNTLEEFNKETKTPIVNITIYSGGDIETQTDTFKLDESALGYTLATFNSINQFAPVNSRPLNTAEKQEVIDHLKLLVNSNSTNNNELGNFQVDGISVSRSLQYYIPYAKENATLDVGINPATKLIEIRLGTKTRTFATKEEATNFLDNDFKEFLEEQNYFRNISWYHLDVAKDVNNNGKIAILEGGEKVEKVYFRQTDNGIEGELAQVLRTQINPARPLVNRSIVITPKSVEPKNTVQKGVTTVKKSEITTEDIDNADKTSAIDNQNKVEALLDKIRANGITDFTTLRQEENAILFKAFEDTLTKEEQKELRDKLKEGAKKSSINSKFTGKSSTTENQDKEIQQLASMLNVDSFTVERMANNGIVVGQLQENGKILLAEEAPEGTLYHEVFEAVYNMFYSPTEQKAIIKALNKENPRYKESPLYKRVDSLYAEKSEDQKAKEYLAEEFRAYVLDRNVRPSNYMERAFERLKRFLKNLIGMDLSTKDRFNQIYDGKFKNKVPTNVRPFGSADMRLQAGDTTYSNEITRDMLDGVTSELYAQLYKKGTIYDLTRVPKEEIENHYKNSLAAVITSLNNKAEELYDSEENTEALENTIIELAKEIRNNPQAIVNQHIQWLQQNQIKLSVENVDDEFTLEVEDGMTFTEIETLGQAKAAEAYGIDANRYSPTDKMSDIVKGLLAGIPMMEKDGQIKTNSLGLVSSMEFKELHDYILTSLAAVPAEMIYEKLKLMANVKPELRIVLNRLGLITDYKGANEDIKEDFYIEDGLNEDGSPILSQEQKQAVLQIQSQFVQHFAKTKLTFAVQSLDDGSYRTLDVVALEQRQDILSQLKEKVSDNITEIVKKAFDQKSELKGIEFLHLDGHSDYFNKTENEAYNTAMSLVLNDLKTFIKTNKAVDAARKAEEENDKVKQEKGIETENNVVKGAYREAILSFFVDNNSGGNLNTILDMYADKQEKSELSLFNTNGERVYAISLHSFLTQTFDTLNHLVADKTYQEAAYEQRVELLDKFVPHIVHVNSKNSAWLNAYLTLPIGFKGIDVTILDGLASADKKQSSSGLGITDKVYQNVNAVLDGSIPFLRAGDRGKENAFRIPNTAKYDLTINSADAFVTRMQNYLVDELATTIAFSEGVFKNMQYADSPAKREAFKNPTAENVDLLFDYFTLLSTNIKLDLINNIKAIMEENETNQIKNDRHQIARQVVEEYNKTTNPRGVSNGNTPSIVGDIMDNMLQQKKAFIKTLKDSGHADSNSWKTLGGIPTITGKEIIEKTKIEGEDFGKEVWLNKYMWNHITGSIEQVKLLTGSFNFYKNSTDVVKRGGTLNGTRQISLTGDAFNKAKQIAYPIISHNDEINGKFRTDRTDNNTDTERFAVFADIEVESRSLETITKIFSEYADSKGMNAAQKAKFIKKQTKPYREMKEADAFSFYSLNGAKEIMLRNADLYNSAIDKVFQKEIELQYAIKQHFLKLDKKDYKKIKKEIIDYDVKGNPISRKIVELEPEDFIRQFNHTITNAKEGAVFTALKAQSFGGVVRPEKGFEKGFLPDIHKESGGTIMPSATYTVDKNGNIKYKELAAVMLELEEKGLGKKTFGSNKKTGAVTNDDGKLNPVYNADGTRNTNYLTQELHYSYIGIQNKITAVPKEVSLYATQQLKLRHANMISGGEYKSEAIKEQITKAERLRVASLFNSYDDTLRGLGLQLELTKSETGTSYKIISLPNSPATVKEKLREMLLNAHKESNNAADENLAASISSLSEPNIKIENLPDSRTIENMIYGYVINRVTRKKVKGKSLPQQPVTFQEPLGTKRTNKSNPALRFYTLSKNGDFLFPMEVKITLPTELKEFVESLTEYDNEGNQIRRGLDVFNEENQEILSKWYEEEYLTPEEKERLEMIRGIGYRIPTQDLDSMENYVIQEFLPTETGDVIIVPTEIVAKSGSDFDIDKLNTHTKYLNPKSLKIKRRVIDNGLNHQEVKKFKEQTYQNYVSKFTTESDTTEIDSFLQEAESTTAMRYANSVEHSNEGVITLIEEGIELLGEAGKEFQKMVDKTIVNYYEATFQQMATAIYEKAKSDGITSMETMAHFKAAMYLAANVENGATQFSSSTMTVKDQMNYFETITSLDKAKWIANKLGLQTFEDFDASLDEHQHHDTLFNEELDTTMNLLSNVDNMAELLSPISDSVFDDLIEYFTKAERDLEEKQGKQVKSTSLIMSPAYQAETAINLWSGKGKLVGIMALQATFLANRLKTNMFLDTKDAFGDGSNAKMAYPFDANYDDKGDVLLNLITDKNGVLISEIISALLTLSVDVANDPKINTLGFNQGTANIVSYMSSLGTPLNQIFKFINSPIVQEYLKQRTINESVVYTQKEQREKKLNEKEKKQVEAEIENLERTNAPQNVIDAVVKRLTTEMKALSISKANLVKSLGLTDTTLSSLMESYERIETEQAYNINFDLKRKEKRRLLNLIKERQNELAEIAEVFTEEMLEAIYEYKTKPEIEEVSFSNDLDVINLFDEKITFDIVSEHIENNKKTITKNESDVLNFGTHQEKTTFLALNKAGYQYAETTVDGERLGVWKKGVNSTKKADVRTVATSIVNVFNITGKLTLEDLNKATENTLLKEFYFNLSNVDIQFGESKGQTKTQSVVEKQLTASEIYSKLGNKTESGNVQIEEIYQKRGVAYAASIDGIFSMRVDGATRHFGNPYSSIKSEIAKGLIATKSTKESVEKYIDWVINSTDARAKAIRQVLKEGKFKNKPIIYYKELGEPSHATALDYLINEYNWNQKQDVKETNKNVKFEEEQSSGYIERTKKNASADATLDFAFGSEGETWTKKAVVNQKKKHIGTNLKSLEITPELVNNFVTQLNSVNAKTLNIAGEGIYNIKKYTQEQIDTFVYDLLNQILNSPNLKTKIISIRTGGQTGFDEAGTKAGIKLGLPTLTLAPKNWTFRAINNRDVSNEQKFKERFNTVTEEETEIVKEQGNTATYDFKAKSITVNKEEFSKLSNTEALNTINHELIHSLIDEKYHQGKAYRTEEGIIDSEFRKDKFGKELLAYMAKIDKTKLSKDSSDLITQIQEGTLPLEELITYALEFDSTLAKELQQQFVEGEKSKSFWQQFVDLVTAFISNDKNMLDVLSDILDDNMNLDSENQTMLNSDANSMFTDGRNQPKLDFVPTQLTIKLWSRALLENFLEIERQTKLWNDATKATGADTANTRSKGDVQASRDLAAKMKASNIKNTDQVYIRDGELTQIGIADMVYNTYAESINDEMYLLPESFTEIFEEVIGNIISPLSSDLKQAARANFVSSYAMFHYLRYIGEDSQSESKNMALMAARYTHASYFQANKVGKQISDMRKKFPNNKFLPTLSVISTVAYNGNKEGIKTEEFNILHTRKKLNPKQKNTLVEDWRELFNSSDVDVRNFAKDLAIQSMLQTGNISTPHSFTDLIPKEEWYNLVKNSFTTIGQDYNGDGQNLLTNPAYLQFFSEHWQLQASNLKYIPSATNNKEMEVKLGVDEKKKKAPRVRGVEENSFTTAYRGNTVKVVKRGKKGTTPKVKLYHSKVDLAKGVEERFKLVPAKEQNKAPFISKIYLPLTMQGTEYRTDYTTKIESIC